MSFTSVLKKIEVVAINVAKDASAVYPFLSPLVTLLPPKTAAAIGDAATELDGLQKLLNEVQDVQAMFAAGGIQMPGSTKAAMLAPKISALFQDLEVLGGEKVGHIVKDPAKFNAAMAGIAGHIADALAACGD
jgi:hypothetical protein